MYKMDIETGNVHSKGRYGRDIIKSIQTRVNRTERSFVVSLRQDGKTRIVSWYRLRFAVEHDIFYDDIPQDIKVMSNEDGSFYLATKREHMAMCKAFMDKKKRAERLQRIDEKIRELEIMKRAYLVGSHTEVFEYIETRKDLLVRQFIKRFSVKKETAEDCYAQAVEWMIDKIHSDITCVTELTVSMMGLMNKVYKKRYMETGLYLNNEKASNSYTKEKRAYI